MNSPVAALTWELWRKNRLSVGVVAVTVLLCWLFNHAVPDHFRAARSHRELLSTISILLAVATFVLVFGMFNYTESDRGKEWTGFPYRLFTLPVSSIVLVGLPMVLGVATVELVFFAWDRFVFPHADWFKPEWFETLIGAYMVFYQAILWCVSGFRLLRLVLLGVAGTSFIGIAFLPFFGRYVPSIFFSESALIPVLSSLALVAFGISWATVNAQRCGGGRRGHWVRRALDAVGDLLPRRRQPFRCASTAQFWFEWRRAGFLLPACVGAALIFVFGPISFAFRHSPETTLWILGWALLMPLLLAGALGKGFSRPDFWANELSLPSFLAVRPIRSDELVAAKMKVAAAAAVAAWLLVVGFLALWLSFWADVSELNLVRVPYWMVYHHSVFPQYVIAALGLVAAALMTWRLLICGLWAGLSGSKNIFIGSAAVYWLMALLLVVGPVVVLANNEPLSRAVNRYPDLVLEAINWLLALAVLTKGWLAVLSWRKTDSTRTRVCFSIWCCGTLCLVALSLLLWAGGTLVLALMAGTDAAPLDPVRLRSLLLLASLAAIPLARIGLTPAMLDRNRHQ